MSLYQTTTSWYTCGAYRVKAETESTGTRTPAASSSIPTLFLSKNFSKAPRLRTYVHMSTDRQTDRQTDSSCYSIGSKAGVTAVR